MSDTSRDQFLDKMASNAYLKSQLIALQEFKANISTLDKLLLICCSDHAKERGIKEEVLTPYIENVKKGLKPIEDSVSIRNKMDLDVKIRQHQIKTEQVDALNRKRNELLQQISITTVDIENEKMQTELSDISLQNAESIIKNLNNEYELLKSKLHDKISINSTLSQKLTHKKDEFEKRNNAYKQMKRKFLQFRPRTTIASHITTVKIASQALRKFSLREEGDLDLDQPKEIIELPPKAEQNYNPKPKKLEKRSPIIKMST